MTTTIVTRAGKGSELTYAEVDANFTNLQTTADAAAVAAAAAQTTANAAVAAAAAAQTTANNALASAQTWQDVTASRAFATLYTNNTSSDIEICVIVLNTVASSSITVNLYASGAIVSMETDIAAGGIGFTSKMVSARVKPGMTYQVTVAQASLHKWSELR